MKNSKTKFMFALVVVLCLGFVATGFAATTNTASSKPPILIGLAAGGLASVVTIAESGAGALATGSSFAIQLPTGVTFTVAPNATPTPAGTTMDLGLGAGVAQAGVLSAANSRVTWTVAAASTTGPASIIISGVNIALAATVVAGDISAEITSGPPANPGLTPGPLVIAEAVTGEAVAQAGASVNIPIGGTTATAANAITITELTPAALSALAPNNTIVFQLPTGVNFIPTVTSVPAGRVSTIAATSNFTIRTALTSNLAGQIVATLTGISQITLTAGGQALGTNGAYSVATVGVAAPETILIDGNGRANFAADLTATTALDDQLVITDVATGSTVTLTLASALVAADVITMNIAPNADETDGGGVEFSTVQVTDTDADGSLNRAVYTIDTASAAADTITISALNIKAGAGVVAGDINVTITSGTALNATLKIAAAARSGIAATAVTAASTFAIPASVALTATTRPKSPAGRTGFIAGGITIVENFADDLRANDALTVTLPAGVTFATNLSAVVLGSNVTLGTVPSPLGFNTLNIPISLPGGGARGGIQVGSGIGISINIDATVPAGDIVATISGTVAGTAITPVTAAIATVVAGGVTIAPNAVIPVVGIGASGAIGSFTLTEIAGAALLANGSTITLTLPAGVTWATPGPSQSVNPAGLSLNSTALTAANSAFTFTVTAGSTVATTITITGTIAVSSTVAPGAIVCTIGGTAGATGTVTVATAANAVTATAGTVPTLITGTPTQVVSNLVLQEAFAGGLGSGSFRLVSSAGSWATAVPTVTVAPAGKATGAILTTFSGTVDLAANNWDYEVITSFSPNDTLLIRTPSVASAAATRYTFAGLRINVAATAPNGAVQISLLDGGSAGTGGAGVQAATLTMGFIGTALPLAATPAIATVGAGGTAAIAVTGGVGAYTATSSDAAVATVSVAGGTVTVNGIAAGNAVITISDSAAPTPATATVNVTVVAVTSIGTGVGILPAVTVAPTDLVALNLSADTGGATAVSTWFVLTGRTAGTQLPIFLVTTAGLVQFAPGIDLAAATFAFTGATLTLPALSMADLGLAAGDQLVYGFAFSDAQGAITIPNIVTINVQ